MRQITFMAHRSMVMGTEGDDQERTVISLALNEDSKDSIMLGAQVNLSQMTSDTSATTVELRQYH